MSSFRVTCAARAPHPSRGGGGERIRTDDRLVANQVLYQLSYAPLVQADPCRPPLEVVGLTGFEPVTSRLSGERSNQLSYRPWWESHWSGSSGGAAPQLHGTASRGRLRGVEGKGDLCLLDERLRSSPRP